MEWIEAGRAGPAPVGRAMQRPAARDAALIPCRVGATEKRNASRAGAAPVPVAPTGRNEIIASERSIGSIAAGAAACRAATGGLAPRRTQAQGVRTNPRRMNRRRAASSPQPQAMHSRSKKQNGTPPVLRGRALMRRTVRCVWRWVIQFFASCCHAMPWAGIEFVASSSSSDTAERASRARFPLPRSDAAALACGRVGPRRRARSAVGRGTGGGEHDTPHRGVQGKAEKTARESGPSEAPAER